MSIETQLLFFFSALGAFNGIIMSLYFFFYTKPKHISNYFLGALLFTLSIRIGKSVFYFFNQDLALAYLQLGLTACFFIGPFLYFYVLSVYDSSYNLKPNWKYHFIPLALVATMIGFLYPYESNPHLWSPHIIRIIYFQWLIYIILSGFHIKNIFKKLFSRRQKLDDNEIWLLSIFLGIAVIWIAYETSSYTSYIVGALSFSFVFYLLLLLWIFKRNKNSAFFEKRVKYANKKIGESEATSITTGLKMVINEKKLFKDPNLKLSDVADELDILPHHLSQFLNDNLGKNFLSYINEYRIKEAEEMLKSNHHFTLEAIGYECGFKSNSTFYSTFKKLKGITPAKFKKEIA